MQITPEQIEYTEQHENVWDKWNMTVNSRKK